MMLSREFLVPIIYAVSMVVMYSVADDPQPVTVWTESTLSDYPNPQTNPQGCNRVDSSWICDPNKVLTKEDADDINVKLAELRDKTKGGCPCSSNTTKCSYTGLPIIITIMEEFQSNDNQSVEQLMKQYATHFAESWPFYECNDGIVYIISHKNKLVYRHYQPDSKALMIRNNCMQYVAVKSDSEFSSGKSEDIAEGIAGDLNIYSQILVGSTTCKDSDVAFVSIIIIVIIVALIVAIIIAMIFIKKRQKQKTITRHREEQPLKQPAVSA